jgi:acyl-[acyl-carrier-protein]-phospholipid O-acyltransferase/long-chain-fatty-acid--[acyl-carrier-protein] ligase
MSHPAELPAILPPNAPKPEGLAHKSFWCLMLALFLNAFNDNVFRWLVVAVGVDLLGQGQTKFIVALGSALFLAPFILLVSPAGYLSDRFAKNRVISGVKFAEVVLMIIGSLGVWWASMLPQEAGGMAQYEFVSWYLITPLLLGVVFLMGCQSALLGPAKYGALPELVWMQSLPKANGIMAGLTFVAIVLGMLVGISLGGIYQNNHLYGTIATAATVITVAVLGWLATLTVRKLAPANPKRKFPFNPFADTWKDLGLIFQNPFYAHVALGIAFFWSLGVLAMNNLLPYAQDVLGLDIKGNADMIGLLLAILTLGTGIGNVAAGWLSAGRIEFGFVTLGALGIAVVATSLGIFGQDMVVGFSLLFLLGLTSGLFEVPLATYLQHETPVEQRGSIWAASNFLTFSGAVAVSGVLYVLAEEPITLANGTSLGIPFGFDPLQIFIIVGLSSVPILFYIIWLIPKPSANLLVRGLVNLMYDFRIQGAENIPERGGALIISNHLSWIDAVVLTIACPRHVRLIAFADNLTKPPWSWVARLTETILLDPSKGPKSVLKTLREAKTILEQGDLVGIFAEGALSRVGGQVLGFQRGFSKVIEGTDAPIIPAYIDGVWPTIFSYSEGRFFWKWPRGFRLPVTVRFGPPIPEEDADNTFRVRQAVLETGTDVMNARSDYQALAPENFVNASRSRMFRTVLADSMGQSLSGGQALMRTIILARLLNRHLADDEKYVGVLLPPSAGAALVNAAITMTGRVAVNLNYTAKSGVVNSCIRQSGIRHVLTSRKAMEKFELHLEGAELVYLEDLKPNVTTGDKIAGFLQSYVYPAAVTKRLWGLHRFKPHDPMTVIFTSGSTGDPKGVVLSYHAVTSNLSSMNQLADIQKNDKVIGILPFFHSFGYTITLWSALTLRCGGVYHFTPLDPRTVGKLTADHKCTILMATPTFIRSYIRRVEPDQFASLRMILVGAEKLPRDVAEAFKERFGKQLLEGYGATEMCPLISVNMPDYDDGSYKQIANREGTVGRPIPGVSAKVVDPEDPSRTLGPDEVGMLYVRGPNMMTGYLNQKELTDEKIVDGWYITGDLASIDNDGFITIAGRLSRFSKIGGEMVPHGVIEDHINRCLGADADEQLAVVTGVRCEKKGERIVVLHKTIEKSPEEIRRYLTDQGLPELYLPGRESFAEIEVIPVLGTGKIALKDVQELAEQKFNPQEATM